MMMLVLLFLGALTILLLPDLLGRYLQRLPDAPLCPGCRAVTRDRGGPGVAAVILPALAVTVLRECLTCGWHGRMRLRLATEGAHKG